MLTRSLLALAVTTGVIRRLDPNVPELALFGAVAGLLEVLLLLSESVTGPRHNSTMLVVHPTVLGYAT